jgi:uncharacterized damage-inducible protein DinB
MEAAAERAFLRYSADKLRQLSSRIETCLGQLGEDQVWARGSENENAVGNLVLHLCGNARQWIVAAIGGRPDVRERDKEFATRGGVAIAGLAGRLRETVAEAVAALEALDPNRLTEPVTIQGYDQTVLEAIYHVVEHFSGHTGQIIFATKLMTGSDLGFYRHLRGAAAHGEKTP